MGNDDQPWLRFVRPEIADMAPYVPGEQPQVGKFIKLNTNENPYPPTPAIRQAIEQVASSRLERYPDPLATSFRLVAAEIFGVTPDHILCGNGSDDILTIVTRALVGKGECVRFPYPSYILYRTLAELQGASSEETPFLSDFSLPESFFQPAPGLKLIYLPNPNSPSGTVVSSARLRELLKHPPCPILIDEAYADFAREDCVALVRENPWVMVSRTLSKSYALAGLRFGFLIAHPSLIQVFRKVKDSYNCDAIAIAAATAALSDRTWFESNRKRILETRSRMTDRARSLGFIVPDSQANFIWCTHPQKSARQLYENLRQHQILVRYMNYPAWGDGIRISVGTDEQVDALFHVLESLL